MPKGDAFDTPAALTGLTAYDRTGDKIGSVQQVYLDDQTGRPEWVTVKTGLFGMKESFVPLAGARREGDDLKVATTKDVVKEAPRVDADQHLDPSQESELYAHYGLTQTPAAPGMGTAAQRPATGRGQAAADTGLAGTAAGSAGRHTGAREYAMRSGAPGEDKANEMLLSEEQLRVGKQEEEVGRARLRKVVVTEDVTTSVPVSHEEVRVVREPVREGEQTRAKIGEEETEVTLHAEKPVTRKDTVPVERVRLETEKVTETREISDKVRKERAEFDGPKGTRGSRGRGPKSGPQH
ncbi:photosystem reaction center subunit H [Streptomyces aureoverticillatus]|nr:photosystem reaction center subunit H [Streptomyces aureoverticillatus]